MMSLVGISLANPAARLTFAAALALATGACNSSEPCEVESVQVRMPSTLVRSGQSVATELFSEAFVGLGSTGRFHSRRRGQRRPLQRLREALGDGSVAGTLEVLAIAPLRLRLDVLAASATGEELRLEGDKAA
jgi:hypothetical protein